MYPSLKVPKNGEITREERKTLLFSAITLAIALNIQRFFLLLPAVSEGGFVPWTFNLPELLYILLWQFAFTLFFGFLNLVVVDWQKQKWQHYAKGVLINLASMVLFCLLAILSQLYIFGNTENEFWYFVASLVRYLINAILVGILIKSFLFSREQTRREKENEELRKAFYDAEIKNLKAQINPHFLFNSLSNLSALVREDPVRARSYIAHLSRVFRYSLTDNPQSLTTLDKELDLLHSNLELLKMRFEEGLRIRIEVGNAPAYRLPHMSLQPLLENAVKHNVVSRAEPLHIEVFLEDGQLVFRNNLNETRFKEPSTGIGLANLSERFRILTGKPIHIDKNDTHFIVILPVKPL